MQLFDFLKIGNYNQEKSTKEVNYMVERIKEALDTAIVFTIPGGIPITEAIVVTWIIMAVFILLCLIFVRNLRVDNPTRKQIVIETLVTKLDGITSGLLGDNSKMYAPYIMTVFIYLIMSNLIGLFGFKPPTKDLNVTAALALMSIILVEASGIRAKGMKGWAKSFAEPLPLVLPFNVLEVFIKPLSLCMRLFGNVLGAFVIMELLKMVVPAVVPVVFSFYFDLFDGLIQAYVFVFLTSLYIREATE